MNYKVLFMWNSSIKEILEIDRYGRKRERKWKRERENKWTEFDSRYLKNFLSRIFSQSCAVRVRHAANYNIVVPALTVVHIIVPSRLTLRGNSVEEYNKHPPGWCVMLVPQTYVPGVDDPIMISLYPSRKFGKISGIHPLQ